MARDDGDDVTRMAHELGAAMRRALDSSTEVADCLARIKARGYELSVALEAQVGIVRPGAGEKRVASVDLSASRRESRPAMTPLDRKFLRSLKIAVDEE